ncbi:MAG TPA: IS110 family transposase, partial [Motilibacteraceae bacterium]|nr:IS110 family transposase [Motilibacteraceae bacterium]
GKSIHGERFALACNKRLKHALWTAAFCSLSDPTCRAYYDRKRAEKKTHAQAVLCLARRRVNVLYAMLRDRTPYRPPLPAAA